MQRYAHMMQQGHLISLLHLPPYSPELNPVEKM
jgi:transposase